MLILPIALDKNEVRRVPWVTWTVIGVCFAVHLALSVLWAGADAAASRQLDQSLQYLGERPYLSPAPRLLGLMGKDGRAALKRVAEQWANAGEAVTPETAQSEQERLNQLTNEALESLDRLASHRLGFVPAEPNPITLVTHTFVHGGWLHLLGNMLFLFLTGPFIEDLFGRPLFGALYVLSGLAGAGAFAVGAGESTVPLVGASGAIAGVMGAFLVRLAARRIELLVLPVPIIPAFRFILRVPAFVVIPLWAIEQVYYATTLAEADSPVAFSAHVGGFAAGLVFAGVLAFLRVEQSHVNPSIERKISIEQNPAITKANDARLAGDHTAARRLIDAVLKADSRNVDAWNVSWQIALDAGDGERASEAGLRLIELHRRGGDDDMIWEIVGEQRWRALRMPSRFRMSVAELLAQAGDAREAIDILRHVSAECAPSDVAGLRALVSEGELLWRAGDQAAARRVFERARGHAGCSEPWLERIEQAMRVSRPTRDAGS